MGFRVSSNTQKWNEPMSATMAPSDGPAPDAEVEKLGPRKRPYHPPRLTLLGDLREVTLGPSSGIGESGNPVVFRA